MSFTEQLDTIVECVGGAHIAVFCGAGIMAGTGTTNWLVPSWSSLLNSLVSDALAVRGVDDVDAIEKGLKRSNLSVYERADVVQILTSKRYVYALRGKIYAEALGSSQGRLLDDPLPPDALDQYPFLQATTRLCAHRRLDAVVSYNYDDFLLRALPKGRMPYAVYGHQRSAPKVGGLPVYYIHGHLPFGTGVPEAGGSDIVLAQDSYFINMMESFSWQTSTQLHLLLNDACIFLGTSLRDANMLRMLNYAKHYSETRDRKARPRVFVVMSREGIVRDAFDGQPPSGRNSASVAAAIIALRTTMLQNSGVELIAVDKYAEVPQLVSQLADRL